MPKESLGGKRRPNSGPQLSEQVWYSPEAAAQIHTLISFLNRGCDLVMIYNSMLLGYDSVFLQLYDRVLYPKGGGIYQLMGLLFSGNYS